MTPHDPTSLDPEEHALAQRLARVGPHGEPSPALDSRILAAAHAAVAGHRGASPRRPRRWPLGLGVAASLALALGLAWQLRPLPEVAPAYRSEADSASGAAPTADSSAGAATETTPPPAAATPVERAQREAPVAGLSPPARAAATEVAAEPVPLPAPPAPPAPASPPREPPIVFDAPASMQARSAPEPANGLKATATPEARAADASVAAPSVAAPQAFGSARTAAEASGRAAADSMAMPPEPVRRKLEAPAAPPPPAAGVGEDMPLEDVPPATVASPQVRDAWLARIRELATGGKLDDARASLREFQHRYPDYPLPDDLRALQP